MQGATMRDVSMPQVPEKAVPVLYLDIDGTVRQGKDDALGRFVNGPEDVVVFPEAVEMMRRGRRAAAGSRPSATRAASRSALVSYAKVASAMAQDARGQCGGLFDLICFCVHHPKAEHPEMARCWCRKPSAGLIIEAALEVAQQSPASSTRRTWG